MFQDESGKKEELREKEGCGEDCGEVDTWDGGYLAEDICFCRNTLYRRFRAGGLCISH